MPSGVAQAAELHTRGVAEQNLGHPARALRLLEHARRVIEAETAANSPDAVALLAAVWISIALNEAELFGFERGLGSLEKARHLALGVDDSALRVRVHSQYGLIALRAGRFDVALTELSAAETMLEHADANDRFAILLNTGTLRLWRRDLAPARRSLSRAVDAARVAAMPVGEFKALHNLGYVEFLAGDLPSALGRMEEAGRVEADVSRGIWLLDRARVLVEAGLTREADHSLADAAAIFRHDRLAQDLAETELERARGALVAGDFIDARRFASQARDRFRKRGNEGWRRSADLVLLQADAAAGRYGTRVAASALRLKAELDADGLRLPARTAGLIAAESSLTAGAPEAAVAALASCGPLRHRDPISARLHDRYVRARLDMAFGAMSAGSRQVRAGLAELARYQASFGSIDLRTSAAVHGRALGETGVAIALGERRPAAVLAAAELSRAVSSRLPVVRPPADQRTAELLAELRQTVESLHAAEQDRDASRRLTNRRHALEGEITARAWTRTGSGNAARVASVDALREALAADGATMVVYVRSAGALHAVVVGARRLRLHELGAVDQVDELIRRARADLDVLAYPRLPNGLKAAARGSLARGVAALDGLLLGPLGVDGRRLVVVTTGALGQLPWGTLPSLRAVPTTVAPSATAWLRATAHSGGGRPDVVAVAGPGLDRAEDEIAGLAQAWPAASVLTGQLATRGATAEAMAHASVVHVAAHGIHQTENALFSSLRLADGPLFAHELDQTARTPEHVVLSACELGLATVRPGDEALGLTSVLLRLGTSSVVAGVARVGDELAAETMIAYHRALAAGNDSAAALASAVAGQQTPVPFACFGAAWRVHRPSDLETPSGVA